MLDLSIRLVLVRKHVQLIDGDTQASLTIKTQVTADSMIIPVQVFSLPVKGLWQLLLIMADNRTNCIKGSERAACRVRI